MPPIKPLSLYQQHVAKWKDCHRCHLHQTRDRIVLARGSVPADIVLIGQSPGYSEDSIGVPFCGPAGILLDQIIERSIPRRYKYAITNLISCIPIDEEGQEADGVEDDDVIACSDRLIDFLHVCDEGDRLKMIICVGTPAKDWFDQKARKHITPHKPVQLVSIVHPAWILRRNLAQRGLEIQNAIVTIATAIEDMEEGMSIHHIED